MLNAYLFDQRQGKRIEKWADTLHTLGASQVLWLDLLEPSVEEEREVRRARPGRPRNWTPAGRRRGACLQPRPWLPQGDALAARDTEADTPQAVAVDCFVGKNWVLTAHNIELAVIEDFRERAEGEGEIGVLDAPSFLTVLLEWVVTSYLRAFDKIEVDLEEFDVRVLGSAQRDAERQINALVEVRRRVGRLRRWLAPHREVFAALSDSKFDPVSTEESAQRFTELAARTETALAAARDAKDAVIGSFDVLIARTEHRTNEIIKVLTVASILLLPGALIAGVMGMNVNFSTSTFAHSPIFWGAVVAILLIAGATLAVARSRRWI